MCFGAKSPPKAPAIQQPPNRDTAAEAGVQERRRLRTQQGVYGNIFTSVLGDPTYGSNVQRPATQAVASLGA